MPDDRVKKNAALELWRAEAMALEGKDFKVRGPLHVAKGEAVDTARFFVKYWKAKRNEETGEVVFPGLEMANGKEEKVPATTGADLLSLEEAVSQANVLCRMATPAAAEEAPVKRARWVVKEMLAGLNWLFDDGVEDERDAQLAAVRTSHKNDPDSTDALASEVDDYCGMGMEYRDELAMLEGFDVGLIDEGFTLAKVLKDRPPTGKQTDPAAAKAMELRNRLATLMVRKTNLVRGAARFVFRNHPQVVREAMSAYERRSRAERRREEKKREED